MDWANEEYKRVYTRDTRDLLAVGWEAKALFWEMLRKADHAGVVDADADVLPELVRIPVDVVTRALPKLVARGMVEDHGTYFFVTNHEPAQTTSKSDRQRQKESRARRITAAKSGDLRGDVTFRDEMSRAVTDGHTPSQVVTQNQSTKPKHKAQTSRDVTEPKAPRKQPSTEALELAGLLAAHITARDPKAKTKPDGWADAIDKLHRIDGREWSQIRRVIDWCQADPFWQSNILSGAKLRSQFTSLVAKMAPRRPVAAAEPRWL